MLGVYRSETLQLHARKDADATRTQYVSSLSCSAHVLSKSLLSPFQLFSSLSSKQSFTQRITITWQDRLISRLSSKQSFTHHHSHLLAPALTTAARWRGRSFAALLDNHKGGIDGSNSKSYCDRLSSR